MNSLSIKSKIIIAFIALLLAGAFWGLFNMQKWYVQENVFDMQEIVSKKNMNKALTEEEAVFFEETILKKQDQRMEEIQAKAPEEIQLHGYTQDELDFIANPRIETENDLGIIPEKQVIKVYTQEELDFIANPK